MIYMTFKAAYDGSGGWVPEDAPANWTGMPPSSGGMWHDMLDHHLKYRGSGLGDELFALGARSHNVYVRYYLGHKHLVNDLRRFSSQNNWVIPPAPRKTRFSEKDIDFERLLSSTMYSLKHIADAKWQNFEDLEHWLRLGYRWAKRRYGKLDMNQVYEDLRGAIPTKNMGWTEHYNPGDRFRMGLCLTTGKVSYEHLT